MVDYRHIIKRHEERVNSLKVNLHESYEIWRTTKSGAENWERAAAAHFNQARSSEVSVWLADIEKSKICDWQNARDFAFQYLEVDPMYNHSGYAKEMLIRRIKCCEFSEREAEILRVLVINRIQRRAYREFRNICRLIPRIKTDEFRKEVEFYTTVKDSSVVHRATFALRYFERLT